MSELRTITLPTIDYGDVTLTCPTWCAGHPARPELKRADLTHASAVRDLTLTLPGGRVTVLSAYLVQRPYAVDTTPHIWFDFGDNWPQLAPVDVYDAAAALDTYADRLRDLADQLAAILAGGGR